MLRLLLIAVVPFVLMTSIQAQTNLNPEWKTGDKLKYEIKDEYISKISVSGEFFELHQKLILNTTWETKRRLPNGGVEISVKIERVRFTAEGKGAAAIIQNLTFDSQSNEEPRNKPEQGVRKVLTNYVGDVAVVKLDENENVTDFVLSDAVSQTLKDTGTRELAGFFGDLFARDGLRHRLTNWMVALPDEPVSVNESWSQTVPSRIGPKIDYVREYDLVESNADKDARHLQVKFTPEFRPADGSKFKITDQSGKGSVKLDSKTHHIIEFALKHKGTIMSSANQSFDIVYTAALTPDESIE
jgi:hypothetical protein